MTETMNRLLPWRGPTALAAVALGLAGCAAGPNFEAPGSQAPADFASWHGGAPELAWKSSGEAPAPDALRRVFADPVLERLQARAVEANSDLKTAALRFAQSRTVNDTARGQFQPQVNLSGTAGRAAASENGDFSRVIGAIAPASRDQIIPIVAAPHDNFQLGFDATWELDLWGRVRRTVEAADADDAAAQALLAQARLSLQAEVARRYFELRAMQRQVAITREEIATNSDLRDLVATQTARGLGTDLEVNRQDAQLADSRARLPQLQAQEALLINQLTLLVGAQPGALAQELAPAAEGQTQTTAQAAAPDFSLGLPSDVALRRPDIQRAQAQLHSATASIGVAKADLYPRISIGAAFALNSVDASTFTDWGSRQWQIGPTLQLPLFDGGRRRATVTLRELQQQEAAVNWQQIVLKAWHEIDDSLSTYSAERQRNARLADMETAGRDAWELARVRYSHGLTDQLPALDAQRTYLQARRALADSTGRLSVDLVAISKALGVAPTSIASESRSADRIGLLR